MSGSLRIDVPPHVAEVIRTLPPEIKRSVKEALRLLVSQPDAGEPLRRELRGYWRYRVRRYRIVYQREARVLRVVAVGHRRSIYEDVGEGLRTRGTQRRRAGT
ncbi:MAG: cytotoxin [Deltaproteobacteria bacterium]|nr:cytotoxin [Deltaproteobacteria bacterium]